MEAQQPLTSDQTLDMWRLCSVARTDQNVSGIIKNIWHKLCADSMAGDEFEFQYYSHILKFASDRQDVKHTQAIFDEMVADAVQSDA